MSTAEKIVEHVQKIKSDNWQAYVDSVRVAAAGDDSQLDPGELYSLLLAVDKSPDDFAGDVQRAKGRNEARRAYADALAAKTEIPACLKSLQDLEAKYQSDLEKIRVKHEPEIGTVKNRLEALQRASSHRNMIRTDLIERSDDPAAKGEMAVIDARRTKLKRELGDLTEPLNRSVPVRASAEFIEKKNARIAAIKSELAAIDARERELADLRFDSVL